MEVRKLVHSYGGIKGFTRSLQVGYSVPVESRRSQRSLWWKPAEDTDAEANLQRLVLDGRVQTGDVVHWEGTGERNPSGPIVVMSSTGPEQEQGVGVHDVGSVALQNRDAPKDMIHSNFATT